MRSTSLPLVLALATAFVAPAAAQTAMQGWHSDGQTWLVWDEPPVSPPSYEIYASTVDFLTTGDVSAGTLVGRILPGDWRAPRLKIAATSVPSPEWSIPQPGGGTASIGVDQALFVHTPHAAAPEYFAVVQEGQTAVAAANSVGPISQTVDPVQCHLQFVDTTPAGQTYRVYTHWIDGRADHADARADYPVMGNEHLNGTPWLFLVTDPVGGAPAAPAPAIVALHGGGGHFMQFVPGAVPELDLVSNEALVVTFDGTMQSADGTIGMSQFGYWQDFDRFTTPFNPTLPSGAVIVDYAIRRMTWALDWLEGAEPIDPARVSVVGHSAGSKGAGVLGRRYPERFATVHLYAAHLQAADATPMFGTKAQNLATTLPLGTGISDVFDETTVLSPTARDFPFTRVVIGRGDTISTAMWSAQKVDAYHAIDDTRMGRHLYWDERKHGFSGWSGSHFDGASPLRAAASVGMTAAESFPAIYGDDHDPSTPGRQPDMGDGQPLVGDPWGTFGGYVRWDRGTLVDSATTWSCDLWLAGLSPVPQDNFAGAEATVGVAIRKPQAFAPPAGVLVHWRHETLGGALLDVGTAEVEADGLVAIDGLTLTPDPNRTRLVVRHNPNAPMFGAACAGTGGYAPILFLGGALAPATPFALRVDRGLGGSNALLLFGAAGGAAPMGSCTLNVSPLLSPVVGPLPLSAGGPGEGSFVLTGALPAGLAGVSFAMQGVCGDAGAPDGFTATNGVEVTLQP